MQELKSQKEKLSDGPEFYITIFDLEHILRV